jgi:glycosyltransferase involved in cell wall biosynthesis
LAKYLSKRHKVALITSAFPEEVFERSYDIGNAYMIEIPLKFYRRNPYTLSERNAHKYSNRVSFLRRLKAELRIPLERIFPISSGGILYHDIGSYKQEIEKLISKEKTTVLITTYDPWFTLKLGNYFKRKYEKLLWIADFRDPSFGIHESRLSNLPLFKMQTKKILGLTDLITVVTKYMQKSYSELTSKKVVFLPNGYDGNLFFEDNLSKIKKENCLSIAYTGSLHPRTREISCFVTVLEKVATIAPQVKIIFNYAGFQADIVEAEFSKRRLGKLLNNHGLLKRDQALELQKQADILLLIVYTGDDPEIGKSIRTGKVYEYLASGKPILAIAPRDWEMKEEIECDGVSKVFDKNQIDEMAQYLIDLASRSKIEINIEKRKEVIEKYLYKNLALKLEQELESLVREKERDQL